MKAQLRDENSKQVGKFISLFKNQNIENVLYLMFATGKVAGCDWLTIVPIMRSCPWKYFRVWFITRKHI